MLYYQDIIYPNTEEQALHSVTGKPLHAGVISGGQLAYAKIAKTIVDYGPSLDQSSVDQLCRFLKGVT